jgi:hypothetical protein
MNARAPNPIPATADTGAERSAESERLARAEIEQRNGQRIGDGEWAKQRQGLIEFVLILARWESEERRRKEEPDPDRAA